MWNRSGRSRPARARGLKRVVLRVQLLLFGESRPARARGLKRWLDGGRAVRAPVVAPRAGAWIETAMRSTTCFLPNVSRPARARGLKQRKKDALRSSVQVAPRAGAWIETQLHGVG